MAMRSVVCRSSLLSSMKGVASRISFFSRYSTDSKGGGRVLSEEERARENVYIQKLEREKLEKIKKKLGYVEKENENENENPEKEKDAAEKKTEGDSR
ncbi:hypothetical protein RDABS01_031466 [Bienertia sinuspersici]